MSDKPIDYKAAGVDIVAADSLVDYIKETGSQKRQTGVLGGIGGFGAFFELPWSEYKQPVLVSGTDGCGTKLRVAIEANQHETIGIDLVAMCANDIVTSGAKPLYFLDYYATGALDLAVSKAVIRGIMNGCEETDMVLAGGETAEMPGMYGEGDYDLAGFCVGIVEKDQIIDGRSVVPGDVMIAMGSSGVHANGFSLVRKVLSLSGIQYSDIPWSESDKNWGELLLEPTRLYVRAVVALQEAIGDSLKALAHITGGGLAGNVPRVLPEGVQAVVNVDSWSQPQVFDVLEALGPIEKSAMRETFNLGIGMVAVVPESQVDAALSVLASAGEEAWVCGHIQAGSGPASLVFSDE